MASPDLLTIFRSPQFVATAIGLAGLGFFVGYRGGLTSATGSKTAKKSWPNSYDVTVHRGSSDEEDEADEDEEEDEDSEDLGSGGDGKELQDFSRNNEEVKLVLVVRTDLGMQKGRPLALSTRLRPTDYLPFRQNSSTSLPRDPSMLQISFPLP